MAPALRVSIIPYEGVKGVNPIPEPAAGAPLEAATEYFGYLNNALFVILALICVRRWRKTRGAAAGYAALSFGAIGLVGVSGLVTPEDAQGSLWFWVGKLVIATLLVFPYFLYRFATSFVRPSRALDLIATGLTGVLITATLLLPEFPEPGEPRGLLFQAYVIGLLVQWTFLSVLVAGRLWRAGKGQPTLARRRMRLLALGASALNVVLLVAGLIPSAGTALDLANQMLTAASSIAFFLGLETPRVLRVAWRQKEEESFRRAVQDVVAANTPTQVATKLLPHAARIAGARGVSLIDADGSVIAAFRDVDSGSGADSHEEIRLDFANGSLVMTGSPYTPYFGQEEVRLVAFLGDLMNIALERSRLYSLQELILQAAGEGIYGVDNENRVTFMNSSAAEMLGWTLEELAGRHMHDATHHTRPDGSPYPLEECPIATAAQTGRSQRVDDEVFWRKEGTSFPVEYTSTPIQEGEKITGVVVTFSDISDRKAAEAARAMAYEREQEARARVEEANRQLEEAQALAHIGSWSWDLNSGELAWSDEMYRIYGLSRDAAVSYELAVSMTHPEDMTDAETNVREAVQQGSGFSYEFRAVRPNGEIRNLLAVGRAATGRAGQEGRVIGTVQDVTERKQAERALNEAYAREREARKALEETNAEMESFVYTVSHDLNSPLVSVSGYLEYLNADYGSTLPEQGQFFLERMKASTTYMQALIRDLLEFSRVGRMQTDPEPIDLTRLMAEIVEQVKGSFPALTVAVAPLPVVSMNPVRARQLFTNLLQNAARYAGDTPHVEVAVVETGDGRVCLSVADDGPGIPPDQRKRAFDVFQRLNQGQTQEGTGIGLAICKRIVERSGGEIWLADSERGADVRMTLPLVTSATRQEQRV